MRRGITYKTQMQGTLQNIFPIGRFNWFSKPFQFQFDIVAKIFVNKTITLLLYTDPKTITIWWHWPPTQNPPKSVWNRKAVSAETATQPPDTSPSAWVYPTWSWNLCRQGITKKHQDGVEMLMKAMWDHGSFTWESCVFQFSVTEVTT